MSYDTFSFKMRIMCFHIAGQNEDCPITSVAKTMTKINKG